MRQENYRNKMKVNRVTTALLGIFFYVLLVLVLKTIQNYLNIGSTGMKVFNIIEFSATAIFLVLYTWLNFKDATQETNSTFGKYLLLTMIPLLCMTLMTVILSYVGTSSSFGGNWNALTFVVGPTVFCYIPYGIITRFMSSVPMVLFYVIALVLMVLFQYLGFVLGSGSRKFARERELVRAEQSRRAIQRQDEMARQAVQQRRQRSHQKPAAKRQIPVDENDPLKDIESTPVIETEAFTSITDEMIEEAIRLKKIKTVPDKTSVRNSAKNQKSEVRSETDAPFIKGTRQDDQPVQNQSAADQNQDSLHSTQNIQKELEILRRRLAREDKNKK